MSHHEEEITIKLKLSFDEKKFIPHYVILYCNKNFRIVHDRHNRRSIQQIKKTTTEKYFLAPVNGILLPCKYTKSTETPTFEKIEEVNSILQRMVLYSQQTLRISVEFENGKYYLKGEIENLSDANSLYEKYYEYLNEYNVPVEFDFIETARLNEITSRKLRHYCEEAHETLAVKYKYNGYKAKLFVGKHTSRYTDSINRVLQIENIPDELKKFPNVVFQLEIMKKCVIITDVVGAEINNNFYIMQPYDVLTFFESFQKILPVSYLKTAEIEIDRELYPCYVQSAISKDSIKLDDIDGYICVSHAYEYKFKYPSCDVAIKNGKLYISSDIQIHNVIDHTYEDGIYEITQDDNENVTILRRRYDRKVPATQEEYEKYKKLIATFYSNIASTANN